MSHLSDEPLPRGENCPSELLLDRLHLGELAGEELNRTRLHVEGCDRCRARLELRGQGLAAFPELDADAMVSRLHVALSTEVETVRERPGRAVAKRASGGRAVARLRAWLGRPWPAVGLAAAAAAAALLLVVGLRSRIEPGGDDPGDVRIKGGLSLRLFVKRGERASEVTSGERLPPGEQVRFAADLPQAGHFMLVGVEEAAGNLYAAHPLGGSASVAVASAAGSARPAPVTGSMALDESRGHEWLHAILCPRPFSLRELEPGREPGKLRLPAGCRSTPFLVDKGS